MQRQNKQKKSKNKNVLPKFPFLGKLEQVQGAKKLKKDLLAEKVRIGKIARLENQMLKDQKRKDKKKASFNELHKAISKKEMNLATSPIAAVYDVDGTSRLAMQECFVAMISKFEDVLINTGPALTILYLEACFLIFMEKVGVLQGDLATQVPPWSGANYLIPQGYAIWLSYLAPYCYLGVESKSSHSFGTDITPQDSGWGSLSTWGSGVNLTRDGLPNWQFFNQTTGTDPVVSETAFGYELNSKSGDAIPPSLVALMTDQDAMSAISQNLSSIPGMVSLQSVALRAPGPEAYVRPNSATGRIVDPVDLAPPIAFVSVYPHYNPEIALLFNLTTIRGTVIRKFAKPLQRQIFDYPTSTYVNLSGKTYPSFGWWMQPFMTLTRIMRERKVFTKQSIQRQLKWGNGKLKSLFPRPYYLSSFKMQTIAVADYKAIMKYKNNEFATLDPNAIFLTIYSSLVVTALQMVLNFHEFVPMNTPSVEVWVGSTKKTIFAPQMTYLDHTAKQIKLGPLAAKFVSEIGSLNNHGYVHVPVINYQDKGFTFLGTDPPATSVYDRRSLLGPKFWSSFGFGEELLETLAFYNNLPNLYTLSWGTNKVDMTYEGVPIGMDVSGAALVLKNLDEDYVNAPGAPHIGWSQFSNQLFPMTLTGQILEAYTTQWADFIGKNNSVEQPAQVHVTMPALGSVSNIIENDLAVQNNFTGTPLSNYTVLPPTASGANFIKTVAINEDKIYSTVPLTAKEAISSALSISGNETDVLNSNTDMTTVVRFHIFTLSSLTVPKQADATQSVVAPHSINLPTGNNVSSLLSSMADDFAKPGSFLNKLLTKSDQIPVKNISDFTGLIGKNQSKKLLGPVNSIIQKQIKTVANRVIGTGNMADPKKLGAGLGKMLSSKAATAMMGVVSRRQVQSQENVSSGNIGTHIKGIFQDGWDVAKESVKGLFDDGTKAVKDGIKGAADEAGKAVKGAADDVIKGIGDIF